MSTSILDAAKAAFFQAKEGIGTQTATDIGQSIHSLSTARGFFLKGKESPYKGFDPNQYKSRMYQRRKEESYSAWCDRLQGYREKARQAKQFSTSELDTHILSLYEEAKQAEKMTFAGITRKKGESYTAYLERGSDLGAEERIRLELASSLPVIIEVSGKKFNLSSDTVQTALDRLSGVAGKGVKPHHEHNGKASVLSLSEVWHSSEATRGTATDKLQSLRMFRAVPNSLLAADIGKRELLSGLREYYRSELSSHVVSAVNNRAEATSEFKHHKLVSAVRKFKRSDYFDVSVPVPFHAGSHLNQESMNQKETAMLEKARLLIKDGAISLARPFIASIVESMRQRGATLPNNGAMGFNVPTSGVNSTQSERRQSPDLRTTAKLSGSYADSAQGVLSLQTGELVRLWQLEARRLESLSPYLPVWTDPTVSESDRNKPLTPARKSKAARPILQHVPYTRIERYLHTTWENGQPVARTWRYRPVVETPLPFSRITFGA